MRFGFFDQLPCPDGFTERQRYKDILAQIDLADTLGFDTAWLGEIHFIRQFSISGLNGQFDCPIRGSLQLYDRYHGLYRQKAIDVRERLPIA
jgi:alkanesulfonate monooxygenase SsuD/methylene tetrahydromethanopterin reductase-like flavin-dependent oxidoreductase (luciferase family)